MKIVTMCHWRRPDYSAKCLEYLGRCHGIANYTVIIHIDGLGDPKVADVCRSFKAAKETIVVVRHEHLGCNRNTRNALESGFKRSDYVIHIEDDILVARDGLKYMEWAAQFKSDQRIFTTGLWRHNDGWLPNQNRHYPPEHDRQASLISGFFVWGWGTWSDRWREMKEGWTKGDDATASWDTVLTTKVRGPRGSLLPLISRANNIGEHLGTHRGAAYVEHWADSPGFIEPAKFERVF